MMPVMCGAVMLEVSPPVTGGALPSERSAMDVPDEERQAIYRQIYTIIRDDAPWIFLYNPTLYWGVASTMKDWKPRADGLLIF